MKSFFLPIDGSNLGAYYSSALIVPQIYLNDLITDFQSVRGDRLLLTTKRVSTNADCCLEVLLTDEEANALKKENDYIYSSELPLPITRIKGINFYSEEIQQNSIGVAESSAFIPNHLVQLLDKNDFENVNKLESVPHKNNKGIREKIDLYDRYLGGFAFMRFGGTNYMNYSLNYFPTLAYFSSKIQEQYDTSCPDPIQDIKYIQFFDKNDVQWDSIRKTVYGSTSEIKDELKGLVSERSNIYLLDKIDDNKVYYKAVLANFGPGRQTAKTTDALFQDILKGKIKQRELITLLFGVHNGYRQFNRSYNLDQQLYHAKFKLDNQLDYYTIESIYQEVYDKVKSEQFEFIQELVPNRPKHKKTIGYYSYNIFDKEILYARKPKNAKEYADLYVKRLKLESVIQPLIVAREKRNDLKLSDEQYDCWYERYYSLIGDQLHSYLEKLGVEIFEDFSFKIEEYMQRVAYDKGELDELNLLLKQGDRTLFDEIDMDGDGILTQTEIGIFIDKIIKANNNYRSKEAIIEPEDKVVRGSQNIPKFETVEKKDQVLLQVDGKNDENLSESYNKAADYILHTISLAELGKLAKKNQIVSTAKKVSTENKEDIINQLLNYLRLL